MDEVLYVSDTIGAHEAAKRFSRVHATKQWNEADMALFRIIAANDLNVIVWEGDVWLPVSGVSLEDAIKLYPRWRSDLAITFSRVRTPAEKT